MEECGVNKYAITKLSDYKWRVERDAFIGMNVPGIIFSDKKLLEHTKRDGAVNQIANVAALPGIIEASFGMPDIHFGYGFPIGGVAAFDPEAGGIISPGGVGFDISCGVRAVRTSLETGDIKNRIEDMMSFISFSVPRGPGGKGKRHRIPFSKRINERTGVKKQKYCTDNYGSYPPLSPSSRVKASLALAKISIIET